MNDVAMGLNVKITAAHPHRAAWTALFGALGVELAPGPSSAVIGRLADGGHFGVFFVEPAEALPEDALLRAPWLELRVRDPVARGQALEALGVPRHPYHDTAHAYFRAPGGVVFRLAPLG